MDTRKALLAFTSTSLLALAAATGAHAQVQSSDAPAANQPPPANQTVAHPTQLNEVVVTAQKRAQRVQDVPESVSVASQAQLERQEVNQIADLARVTPSLEIQQTPGQSVGGGGQLRGIGTQSFQQGAVGSVALVVDQVSEGNANISDLFDVSRIEVLKGPQGTLFGLTTSAGVINIVTNEPVFNQFSGRFRTQLSSDGTAGSEYGQQVVQGVVNLPISDTAAMRVSANYDRVQGVDRNTYTGDLDPSESYNLRARLLWRPIPKLRVNLIGDYTRSDASSFDFFVIYKANPALAQVLASCGITASDSNRDYCSNGARSSHNNTFGGSAQVDYDAGPFTLTSITALRGNDGGPTTNNIFRLDPNVEHIEQGPAVTRNDIFTQELRIASPSNVFLEYTAGLFYSKQASPARAVPFNLSLLPAPGVVIPVVNVSGLADSVDDESSAVFGQATVHLTQQLRLILGGRYTHETLNVFYHSTDTGITGADSSSVDNFSWKVGPQYEFSRNLQAYAFVARGYKGPQIATADPTNPVASPSIIKPEIPTDYEVGLKATVLDGRLLADLNAFYFKDRDYQGQVCIPEAAGGLQCVPQNISEVVSKGVELDLSGRPLEGLSLNSGAIWNQAEYPKGFLGQDGTDLSHQQLLGAPEWKITASAEYTHPIVDRLDGFVDADAVYKSRMRFAASTDPNVNYPDHVTIGARLGIRNAIQGWSVDLFVRNLNQSREPAVRYQNFPDGSIGSYGQILTPQAFRQVGLELTGSF